MSAPRILIYDLETSPVLQWRFTAGRDEGRALRVDEDSRILSMAWTWLGDTTVHALHNSGQGDGPLVAKLWDLFDEADILIAHNGDRFDQPKANTRFFAHGYGPPSPYQTIDTLKVARHKFAHHSNTLDALTRLAGTEQKKQHEGISLWFSVMEGDPRAMVAMLAYNKQDVVALKELYLALLPWMDRHPNMGIWQRGRAVCTNCGSQDLQKRGTHKTRVNEYQRYRCNTCGYHPRQRLSERSEDRVVLT
jgi:hypothetical protein